MVAMRLLGKISMAVCLLSVFSSQRCPADESTPMDAPLPPGKITTITCECTDEMAKKYKFFQPAMTGTYHYKVLIPEGYDTDKDRKYPVFFFFSPGGNAGMYGLDSKMKSDKWIAIMAVEAKNGPFDVIFGNIVAAWEDANKRLRVFDGMTCATGFSGGARMSGACITTLPTGAGIICQGAGPGVGPAAFPGKEQVLARKIAMCMFAGKNDPNIGEIAGTMAVLGGNYPNFYADTFDGKHEPSPKDLMEKGYNWLVGQICSTAEPGKVPKPFLLDFVKNKNDEAGQLSSIIDKMATLTDIVTLVTKQNLDKDADFKEIAEGAKSKIAEIKKDPSFRKESAAKDAYVKAVAYENDIRKKIADNKVTGNDLKNGLTLIINSYKTVARIHKDTAYGQKAADKAAEIEKERG